MESEYPQGLESHLKNNLPNKCNTEPGTTVLSNNNLLAYAPFEHLFFLPVYAREQSVYVCEC